jgi:hypothetical protein
MFLLILFIFTSSDTQSKIQDKPNYLNNMLMNAALCVQLYRECKTQLGRQPPYDVHDELRNLR